MYSASVFLGMEVLLGSHGVTLPIRERQPPAWAGWVEEEKAQADLESAAQALDGVGLD
jgi:hypothetical protein